MPDRLLMEDAALAEEARNGNSAAFVKLANRWWTPLYRVSWIVSGSALVERKDRSYDAGLRDSPEKRVRRVQDEVRNSKIQTDAGACRILSVGFQHLVTAKQTPAWDRLYGRGLKPFKQSRERKRLPHFVLVEHLGFPSDPGAGSSKGIRPPRPVCCLA